MYNINFQTFLLLLMFLLAGLRLQAQSINDQFKTVVEGSNNFQEYKVIKQTEIKTLWANTVDSLNRKEAKLNEIRQQLSNQKSDLKNQRTELASKEKMLQESLDSANSISLFGVIKMEKSSYRIVVWSLVAILMILIAVFYFTSNASRKEAKYRIKLFEEVQEEFKNYKLKTNENEKKLARALQDERNKLAENNLQ